MLYGLCVPLDGFSLARDAGYDYVEFPGFQVAKLSKAEAERLAAALKDAGIPCRRINAYCAGTPAIVGPAADDGATRVYAETLFENAAILGAECVGIGAPAARRVPEGYDAARADEECVRFLKITASVAQRCGIRVLLEAVQHEMCNYLTKTPDALQMAQRLAIGNLGLVVDLYHMAKEGEDLDTLPTYLPLTRHMHVSTWETGLRRRLFAEADAQQLAMCAAAIKKSGYDGTLSAEPDAKEISPQTAKTGLALLKAALADA